MREVLSELRCKDGEEKMSEFHCPIIVEKIRERKLINYNPEYICGIIISQEIYREFGTR